MCTLLRFGLRCNFSSLHLREDLRDLLAEIAARADIARTAAGATEAEYAQSLALFGKRLLEIVYGCLGEGAHSITGVQ